MKKTRLLASILIAALILAAVPVAASAASYKAPTQIKSGYKVDLNGDKKKETITITEVPSNISSATVKLQIGKSSISFEKNFGYAVYVGDINKKDKYKEIFVVRDGFDVSSDCHIYRYTGKKIEKIKATFKYSGKTYKNKAFVTFDSYGVKNPIRLYGNGKIAFAQYDAKGKLKFQTLKLGSGFKLK